MKLSLFKLVQVLNAIYRKKVNEFYLEWESLNIGYTAQYEVEDYYINKDGIRVITKAKLISVFPMKAESDWS